MRLYLTLLLATLINLFIQAQNSTQAFGFQGYAVDSEGKALAGQSVTVKFTISPDAGSGTTYVEEDILNTDGFGVFSTTIGGTSGDFQVLNFASTQYKMKVEVKEDGGTYSTISDDVLNAVPYARAAANGVPVGTIVPFAGSINKIPSGWALCDGSSQDGSSSEWKQLYNVIGTEWGGSSTSFRVPDLRGRFLRGVDDGSGNDPDADSRTASNTGGNTGDNVGTLQGDEFKKHDHHVSDPGHSHSYSDIYYSEAGGTINVTDNLGGNGSDHDNSGFAIDRVTSVSATGIDVYEAGTADETRPKNASVNYIIKK